MTANLIRRTCTKINALPLSRRTDHDSDPCQIHARNGAENERETFVGLIDSGRSTAACSRQVGNDKQ